MRLKNLKHTIDLQLVLKTSEWKQKKEEAAKELKELLRKSVVSWEVKTTQWPQVIAHTVHTVHTVHQSIPLTILLENPR